MGITPNLKLATISEQDNPKVKDFFQDLAGDASTSNMRKIDEAVKKIQDVANAAIASSEKGKAGGVATLGSDKKVVKKQLPDLNYLPDTSTLENIPDGATRKAVTQAEKNTWNAKSNFSGSYNDLTNKPSLDFIPTSDKGVAGGVAPLGEDRKVPAFYIPNLNYIPSSEKGALKGVATLNENGNVPSRQLFGMSHPVSLSTGDNAGWSTQHIKKLNGYYQEIGEWVIVPIGCVSDGTSQTEWQATLDTRMPKRSELLYDSVSSGNPGMPVSICCTKDVATLAEITAGMFKFISGSTYDMFSFRIKSNKPIANANFVIFAMYKKE